jgi:Spy/CpxP family protein refolding chaperone
MRLVCAVAMAGLLAGSAWAADNGGAPRKDPNAAGPGQGNAAGNWSYAKNDRILKCLALTDEQIAKIDVLFSDMQTAQRDLWKGAQGQTGIANGQAPNSRASISKEDMAAIQEKSKALQTAFKTKLMDVLTADQKAKYEAADKIISDSQKAMQDLFAKFNAGAKTAEDRKAMQDEMAKITKDRQDALSKLLGDAYKSEEQGGRFFPGGNAGGPPAKPIGPVN